MKRKGINFKRANHLGWRSAQEGDTYEDGSPIEQPYVVIVRIKDCEIKESNGRATYDASEAPPIALTGHSRTNMAYGTRRRYQQKNYDTRSVYWVEDGYVYRGSVQEEMEWDRQPHGARYDYKGRYYVLEGEGMGRDLAWEICQGINEEFDGLPIAMMRETPQKETALRWNVYVHCSESEKYKNENPEVWSSL